MATYNKERYVIGIKEYLHILVGGCVHGFRQSMPQHDLASVLETIEGSTDETMIAILLRRETVDGNLETSNGLFFTSTDEIVARNELNRAETEMRNELFQSDNSTRLVFCADANEYPWIKRKLEEALSRIHDRWQDAEFFPFLELEIERVRRRLDHYMSNLEKLRCQVTKQQVSSETTKVATA